MRALSRRPCVYPLPRAGRYPNRNMDPINPVFNFFHNEEVRNLRFWTSMGDQQSPSVQLGPQLEPMCRLARCRNETCRRVIGRVALASAVMALCVLDRGTCARGIAPRHANWTDRTKSPVMQ